MTDMTQPNVCQQRHDPTNRETFLMETQKNRDTSRGAVMKKDHAAKMPDLISASSAPETDRAG